MKNKVTATIVFLVIASFGISQSPIPNSPKEYLRFSFDGNTKSKNHQFKNTTYSFLKGIQGKALSLQADNGFNYLELDDLSLNGASSFTIQFWVKTTSEKPTIFLSQKDFINKGILAQKNAGWALYSSGGTFAWSIGSGKERLNYERDNGQIMPINDGVWHQLTMTYDKEVSQIRLYYDGHNKAVYNVTFDFENDRSLVIGCKESDFDYEDGILSSIKDGARQLQALVNEFNKLDVDNVNESEFLSLIVDPIKLYKEKNGGHEEEMKDPELLNNLSNLQKELNANTYTIYQNKNLTKLKPISKLYTLRDGVIITSGYYARQFTEAERLFPAEFSMDNLSIWDRVISEEEVFNSYNEFKETKPVKVKNRLDTLIVAVWNIWHGGKHFTVKDHDWDSRKRIVEMFKKNKVDVILMQETYSSGDYIAAELGYYFGTTSDWDYKDQGSNISVISRYPIEELSVPPGAEFMNVAAKLTLSETQDIYAMSNWYGMSSFPIVYEFHKNKFGQSKTVPILFGGDFNAIPHTDGGESPASVKMWENDFIDAFRSLHPDIKTFPGYSHEWAERIDQLYYTGNGLKNLSTKVIHSWSGGFPSDHYMILSKFKLDY